jgi:CheY-like chemotaxis protein
MLGGDITVTSSPGRGSTFRLTVEAGDLRAIGRLKTPEEAALPAAPACPKSPAEAVRLERRILFAEDGPDNQRLIAFLLRKAGAEVTVAENGQIAYGEALAARDRGEPFDAILMDMQMPVMDGYEATRRLRAAGYTAPIVALTAHAMEGDEEECRAAGCSAYVSKPIDVNRFARTLAEMLGENRQPASLPERS